MTTGYEDLVRRARSLVPEIAPADLAASAGAPPVVVDIREADETATGTIPGAILIPRGVLEKAMPQIAPDPEAARAGMAARQLDGRMGTPQEVAAGILFLASPEARFVNGSAFVMDGGLSAV